jgi:Domain of Unknown Function (DUF1259)
MPSRINQMKLYALISLVVAAVSAAAATLNTERIDQLTGLKGKLSEKEGAYKISFPRDDIAVSVDGWKMPAFMGLTTWAAFTRASHSEAMMMGDTVLFEDEVNLAMFVALESGLSVTALHNHFFFDHPKVFFMHIEGEGTVEHLASSIRLLYDKVREFRAAHPTPADSFLKPPLPDVSTITADPLNKIFHNSGEANRGMIKFTFGRPTRVHGVYLDNTMGVNTWAAFAGSDENAVVDGDVAVTENELQPVLKSLREAGINIVAIHSHMTGEEPRIIFFHYWGRGSAQSLAQSIAKALPAGVAIPTKPRSNVR